MNNGHPMANRRKVTDAAATVMHRPMLWPDRCMKSTNIAGKANADITSTQLSTVWVRPNWVEGVLLASGGAFACALPNKNVPSHIIEWWMK